MKTFLGSTEVISSHGWYAAIVAGMLVGGIMVFVWKYGIAPMGGFWNVYELLPAFILGCAANVIVSLVTPAPEKEIVEEFEAIKTIKG